MYCSDFSFNGKKLSDFGCAIRNIDSSDDSWNAGNITFITVKPPYTDIFSYYTSSYQEPLSFTFQIGKSECGKDKDEYWLTAEEQSALMFWLCRPDGYKRFYFLQDGYEEIYFNVYINAQPIYLHGMVIGLTLVCTADSPYGYNTITISEDLEPNGKIDIINNSDLYGYMYPYIAITCEDTEEIKIEFEESEIVLSTISIKNHKQNSKPIILDYNNDLISNVSDIDNFNFQFPKLYSRISGSKNTITNKSNVSINIVLLYDEVRRVAI